MSFRLSPAQIDALQHMADGCTLQRWPGGYWARIDATVAREGPGIGQVPDWYVGIQTLDGLVRRELVRRVGRSEQVWKDAFIITPAGLTALEQALTLQTKKIGVV